MVDLGWSESLDRSKGAYSAVGAVGQWITVFPSLHMVVAHKTHNIYGRATSTASWQRIIELLFEAKGVKMTEPPVAGEVDAVVATSLVSSSCSA